MIRDDLANLTLKPGTPRSSVGVKEAVTLTAVKELLKALNPCELIEGGFEGIPFIGTC